MKILIDSGLPPQLRHELQGEVYTALYMGWKDWKNGQLMKAAHEAAFRVLITKDASIRHQQNLERWEMALVVLRVERESRPRFLALAPEIREVLPTLRPGDVVELGERAYI